MKRQTQNATWDKLRYTDEFIIHLERKVMHGEHVKKTSQLLGKMDYHIQEHDSLLYRLVASQLGRISMGVHIGLIEFGKYHINYFEGHRKMSTLGLEGTYEGFFCSYRQQDLCHPIYTIGDAIDHFDEIQQQIREGVSERIRTMFFIDGKIL